MLALLALTPTPGITREPSPIVPIWERADLETDSLPSIRQIKFQGTTNTTDLAHYATRHEAMSESQAARLLDAGLIQDGAWVVINPAGRTPLTTYRQERGALRPYAGPQGRKRVAAGDFLVLMVREDGSQKAS